MCSFTRRSPIARSASALSPRSLRSALAALAFAAVCALVAGPLGSNAAHAGAFYIPERGARALSLGGAFIAGADDLNAQWLNPAALTRLSKDFALYVDLGLIFSDQSFARQSDEEVIRKDPTYADGIPSVSDEGPPFPDPSLAIATNFGLEDWVFCLGAYGPYAGTNQWPEDGPQRYSLVSLQAVEFFAQLSVAWRPSDRFSIGIGLQSVMTSIKQRLVISSYPGVFGWPEQRDLDVLAQVDVVDAFTPSGNLGLLITPVDGFDIGLSAQLPVSADLSGKLKTRRPSHYYFSDTQIVGDNINVKLDFPWIFRVGLRAFDPDLWSVELAAVLEMWSALDAISVAPGEGGIAFTNVPGIGTYNVKPFSIEQRYDDVVSIRLGGSWSPSRGDFTVRAGVFYETGAAPDETLSVLDIDGDKLGFAVGGTLRLGKFQIDLTAAWVETFERTVTNSEKTQVNPIYTADPTPYDETGPSTIGNGTYSARNIILATTFSAGF